MKKEKIFWGILFVLGGIFLIASKLGSFPDVNAFSIILTVFLIASIIKSIIRLSFAGILFPLAFICIIYDDYLGITAITPWTVLIAALFGSIGLYMIFGKHSKIFNQKHKFHKFEEIDVEDESHIKINTSFGASIKYVNTDKFERADVYCKCAGVKIYFDNAIMHKGNAVLNINASFSGLELYIPRDWTINDKTNIFLGGIDEKNKNDKLSTNILTLVGDINLSGIEIIYV